MNAECEHPKAYFSGIYSLIGGYVCEECKAELSLREWHKIEARRWDVWSYLILDEVPEPFVWRGGWIGASDMAASNPEQFMIGRYHPEGSDFVFYVLDRKVHAKLLE